MSYKYELSSLEPASFEHLVNAIALKVLGSGATGFGPGPDGGRDGWFEGEAPYPSTRDRWKGVWYIQSKFHAPHLSKDSQKWLLDQLRLELAAFEDPKRGRKWPDNWIIATNVEPSGRMSRGTFDQARKLVQQARPSLAHRFHIWGGQKLCDFLNEYPTIARRFGHFLTPGHVISELLIQLQDERAEIEDVIRYTVVRGIEEQRQTRLEQAGSAEDRRPGIDALFVDLPFVDTRCGHKGASIETLAKASARNHRIEDDEPTSEAWQRWAAYPSRAGVWFVRAGPGRGKSSIGQFFCQVQRAALILQPNGIRVHAETKALAERIRARAQALQCWPVAPRVPLWVELKAYAAWFAEQATTGPRGIASFLSILIHREAEARVTVKALRRALAHRSWTLVFDGLDEVPSDVKDAVAFEVVNFVREMSIEADILVLCTSRPQGYAGQFDALGGVIVDLVDLPPELALECAKRVVIIDRSQSEATRAEALLTRAMQSPAVRELLTTPLQAHIMAVLVRSGQRPPERKWDLYHKFYEVIREREASRDLPDPALRELFQRDPALIDTVHQRLGFALHTRAERASGADASLTKSEFTLLVQGVVQEARRPSEVAPIVQALLRATTERLVLINTPDQGDRVRFDIRAIQEFFAAEYLYVDTTAEILRERLELIAGDSHWREVVQFVLGGLTALRRATEWTVALDVLRSLDAGANDGTGARLARRLARGALHGALFLENGAAENNRKIRDQVKPIIEPISESTEESLVRVMERVSAPETREWVLEWAREQVQRLQAPESRGALRILAALASARDDDSQSFVEFLDTLPTAQVAELLACRHWAIDSEEPPWLADAESRLLRRDDCVTNAPALVRGLLWRASNLHRDGRIRSSKSPRSRRRGHDGPADVVALSKLIEERVVEGLEGVVLRDLVLVAHSGSLLQESQSGFWRWLDLLLGLRAFSTVTDVREVLTGLGDTWTAVRYLPRELRTLLPVPADERITPSQMSAAISVLSESDYSSQRAQGFIGSIRLRDSSDAHLVSFSTRPEPPESFLSILEQYPRAAWSLWCFDWAERYLSYGSRTGGLRGERAFDGLERMMSKMAEAIERDPFIIQEVHPFPMLAGLAALEREQTRAFAGLRAANLRWPLEFVDSHLRQPFSRLALELPADPRLLPVVASARLSDVVSARRGNVSSPRNEKLTAGDAWDTPRVLEEVFLASSNTPDERAAALFLRALHREDGWNRILEARAELTEFSLMGLPIATGVAVIMEAAGLWIDHDARTWLNRLIADEKALRATATRKSEPTLNAVLRHWRERSRAPLTQIGAIQSWLGLSTS